MSMTLHITFFVALLAAAASTNAANRKLDDTTTATYKSLEDQIKCGGCPCNNPCYTTSLPPPPPPPPSPPPPSPPPPPKIPSPTTGLINCPPPPGGGGGSGRASPGYIYITGPPGDVYPVNPYFSGGYRNLGAAPPLLAVLAVLGMLIGY